MLTFDQIKELLELVASHRMAGLELERSGFRLKVEGYPTPPTAPMAYSAPSAGPAPQPVAAAQAPVAAPSPPPAAPSVPPGAGAPAAEDEFPAGAHIVTSPIVGTFYSKPNPTSDSFVQVGSKVVEGEVLCIVEAMKLMNEIESDIAGEIVKVFPKDAQAVEFGEKLFAIMPR